MLTETTQKENGRKKQVNFTLDDYFLDYLEIRRSALIMELRDVDRRLMAGGRLKETHSPGRYQDRVR